MKPGPKRPNPSLLLSKEAQEKVAKILDDPDYLAVLKARAISGRLPAPLEITLWHYRFGVPTINIQASAPLGDLSDAELAQKAMDIAHRAQAAARAASSVLPKEAPEAPKEVLGLPEHVSKATH
jgi:hypothetical protein